MNLKVAYRSYCREFLRPLRTAYGKWNNRRGFIVRVESENAVGYGEIAPLPEFGTETLERAKDFLDQWVEDPIIMPSGLLCCSFALTTAIQHSRETENPAARSYRVAGLLPAGSAALHSAEKKLADAYTTLKWKIGVYPFELEKEIFQELLSLGPDTIQFRLDANGGLSQNEVENWLAFLAPYAEQVEFLEQPMEPGKENLMAELSGDSGIAIALDESLNQPDRKRWFTPGVWSGPLVIKPLLMGNITHLLQVLRPLAGQLVFSSVFETGIGLSHALKLADALPETKYALGFDTIGAFDDSLAGLAPGPIFETEARAHLDSEAIWKRLDPSI